MKFYGYHGVNEHEREMGQRFEVDAEVALDLTKPGDSDELADTYDYVAAYEAIRAVVENRKFQLLEALAAQCAGVLMQDGVAEVTVRVRKPSVPIRGQLDYVQVEVTRSRR
jgi:dihydroneopterin aldolase